jgi:hypothetical protein
MSLTLTLHGVRVPASDYDVLKHLAGILVSQTATNVPLNSAWKNCIAIAQTALAKARRLKETK